MFNQIQAVVVGVGGRHRVGKGLRSRVKGQRGDWIGWVSPQSLKSPNNGSTGPQTVKNRATSPAGARGQRGRWHSEQACGPPALPRPAPGASVARAAARHASRSRVGQGPVSVPGFWVGGGRVAQPESTPSSMGRDWVPASPGPAAVSLPLVLSPLYSLFTAPQPPKPQTSPWRSHHPLDYPTHPQPH